MGMMKLSFANMMGQNARVDQEIKYLVVLLPKYNESYSALVTCISGNKRSQGRIVSAPTNSRRSLGLELSNRISCKNRSNKNTFSDR